MLLLSHPAGLSKGESETSPAEWNFSFLTVSAASFNL